VQHGLAPVDERPCIFLVLASLNQHPPDLTYCVVRVDVKLVTALQAFAQFLAFAQPNSHAV